VVVESIVAGDSARKEPKRATGERLRRRRRFALRLVPLAVLLLVIGVAFSGKGGVADDLGIVALGQGIGLAVALIWLGFGYNPLRKD
jgi:hypothetical protein